MLPSAAAEDGADGCCSCPRTSSTLQGWATSPLGPLGRNSQATFHGGVKEQGSWPPPPRRCRPFHPLPRKAILVFFGRSGVFGVEPCALARGRSLHCRDGTAECVADRRPALGNAGCLVVLAARRHARSTVLAAAAKLGLCSCARSQVHSKQLNFQK